MSGDARWITSISAGGLYAAQCVLGGRAPLDPNLINGRVSAEIEGLGADLAAVGLEPARFFEHAIPLAARSDSPTHVANLAARKILGPRQTDGSTARLARRIGSLWAAGRAADPDSLTRLEQNSRSLRHQWDTRGAGLLAALARLTEPELLVERAEVILVPPITDGGGSPHALYNALAIEAVPADPAARLPEIARLGWLWAHLNLDLPKYQDHVGPSMLAAVGRLAVLPPLLAAAGEVGFVNFDRRLLEAALAAWHAPPVDVDKLLRWWETYQASNPAWSVALGALARMLEG